ncbi:biorientation of chromosomes in cell division protein 1-like 1 isoform X3 [Galleria mellonella]|uniref:Biorientation of chromosomes in cell division protein 1-like 1 isoform X3 n=1 Tax=Galleria mellonella TaxID=7137 RepID=A0A6J1X1X1_GALME|nr:biorientation of chromosomes in cell division protein 1-like 1 isoform X3 [Galleria mellonella]
MSGRSYTMKEMRSIVEYLVTHRAYGEVRGKKMWMDFASTSQTTRTWQSLKETFLKRILPDIHNPYYKLTKEQIQSFRQGYDIEKREKSKLEVCPVDEVSTSKVESSNKAQPSTSNDNDGEKASGEEPLPSKIPQHNRASTETIVLDPEEVQKELESPRPDKRRESLDENVFNKTLRDFITYAEPLTPILHEVLHDFATDESDESSSEPVLKIDENVISENEKELSKNQSENKSKHNCVDNNIVESNIDKESETVSSSIVVVNDAENAVDSTQNKEADQNNHAENNLTSEGSIKKNDETTKEKTNTQNSSGSTNDTALPGNQEQFACINLQKVNLVNEEPNKTIGNNKLKLSRKRANSHDILTNTEIKKMSKENNKHKSISEAGSGTEDKQNYFKHPSTLTSKDRREPKKQSNDECITDKSKEDTNNTVQRRSPDSRSDEMPSSQLNPCLKSVSLFAEQFNTNKYSDSESGEEMKNTNVKKDYKNETKDAQSSVDPPRENNQDKGNNVNKNQHTVNIDKVVILNSQSESDSESKDIRPERNQNKRKDIQFINKIQREKAIASIFGFSSGGIVRKRKRNLSCQKPSTSHRFAPYLNNISVESSEWTSESDSEYISPPRSRKYRQTRKYLKPKSARILSLQEEGGLFVMHGKRIYPLVKDGNIIKNYLTYESDSDKEDDPSYWKKKYEEERKKTEELKVLLDVANESEKSREVSPILPVHSLRPLSSSHNCPSPRKANENKEQLPVKVEKKEKNAEEKTVKIKFTKNNEELQLEGHWSNIHPVLAEVVQIFNKEEKDAVKDIPVASNGHVIGRCNGDVNHVATIPIIITPDTTAPIATAAVTAAPVDEDVRDKVNKLESEIFKEIEERDKEQLEEFNTENNVTNRKRPGRPPKSSISNEKPSTRNSSPRPKRTKKSNNEIENNNVNSVATVENISTPRPKRKVNTPKKIIEGSTDIPANTDTNITNRNSRSNLVKTDNDVPDDDEVRYMFPPNKQTQRKSAVYINKKQKPSRSLTDIHKLFASPNQSLKSIDSTQGYQDSDVSPSSERIIIRRKRKSSLCNVLRKNKIRVRYTRRKSYPYFADDNSSESSNQSNFIIRKRNTSLNPEIYKSESYQLLMPQQRCNFRVLEKIEEDHTVTKELTKNNTSEPMERVENEIDGKRLKIQADIDSNDSVRGNSEAVNSSSISLPLSPELSIVEQLSVSRELLKSMQNQPSINEMQAANEKANVCADYNKYLISELDVSMPLMGQTCNIQKNPPPEHNRFLANAPTISESLLDQIDYVNIKDAPSISDSLDQKLRDLLLESAKKIQEPQTTRDVSNKNNAATPEIDLKKKAKTKKRCSTPCKRKNTQKSKLPKIDPVVEEERMEFCSYNGRTSCPPIQIVTSEHTENNANINDSNVRKESLSDNKIRKRIKKDVLKVKILRPKIKNPKKDKDLGSKPKDSSRASVQTDSGINDASHLFIQSLNDSIDLIHNHSDTCLQTNECIDSVELIEAKESIITLNSNSDDSFDKRLLVTRDNRSLSSELFCNNAQDGTNVTCATSLKSASNSDTVYQSPVGSELSPNSLITEDLSDDLPCLPLESSLPNVPTNKWYLFSEDEVTNSYLQAPSVGANLNQIFPITCAVPDLSTITEMSKENDDNSRKPAFNNNEGTNTNFNSQSLSNLFMS